MQERSWFLSEGGMRKIVTATMIMTMCVSAGFAAFSKDDAGTSTAQFLKLGAGARAAAMGEAYAGVANDDTAIYWNPAGLNYVGGRSATFMHAVWFDDISYDWVSYAQKAGKGTVGIGVQYLSYGSLKGMDATGLETGDFSPSDLAVSLSYARKVGAFGLGVSVKYVSSKIVNTATAYAVDLGAQYALCSDRLILGAAVQNVGTKMKFSDEEDPLPMNVKMGGAYAIRKNWTAALDVNAPIDYAPYVSAGTEYRQKISGAISAAGRLGYNTHNKDTGGTNGVTAGLGITYLGYSLDYAFAPYGELGDTHRVSFNVKF
jgi:hypothetical protein